MRSWVMFGIVASSLTLFSAEMAEIERGAGGRIKIYIDKPETSTFPITLLIPGSQKETSLRSHDSLKQEINQIGQCILTLEKQGIHEEKINEKEFQQALSFDERLNDHLELLKKLKNGLIPGWNGKLSIIGQGDGGRIGAKLASKADSVAALILIASGGGWPPLEEALYSFRSEMADGGYSPQYIQGFLVQAKQVFTQALKTPKVDEKAFGYNYKYWNSLLKTNLLQDLSLLKCPIYTVNGALDNRIPIESVEALAKQCEQLTLIKKSEAGREIIQDPEIYKEAIAWLDEVQKGP